MAWSEPVEEADRLKREWNRRGQSDLRDLYIASHPGWDDPAEWRRRAELDVGFILTGIDEASLSTLDVLEIGSGVGRLALELAPRVRSYTGIEIAPSILEEAQARCAALPNARFFEGDGTSVPEAARDREYGFVFSASVFIHCPKDVIEANLHAMKGAVAPGGLVRYQLLALLSDEEGLDAPPAAPAESAPCEPTAEADAQLAEAEVDLLAPIREAGEEDLVGEGYMGHQFPFTDAHSMSEGVFGDDVSLMRLGRPFIIGDWTRRG